MGFINNTVTNWAFSEYAIDRKTQGFGFSKEANIGRFVSLIDIPSQAAKAVIIPTALVVMGIFTAVIGSVRIAKAVCIHLPALAVCYLIMAGPKTKKVWLCRFNENLKSGGSHLKKGVQIELLAIGNALVRSLVTIGDVVGIVLPEIGRHVRINAK